MESTSLITIDTVSKVQKELDSYDRRSLVFLLYDNPMVALQRITENDNALKQWAIESSKNHNWQEKFIESLAICKLYGVIKKLGFDLSQVKSRYSPHIIDTSVYVDPDRKLFYLTSEQIKSEDLNIIKNNISFDIDAADANDLEIIILKVMCKGKYMEKLLTAMSKIPLLTTFLFQIRERISDKLLSELSVNDDVITSKNEIDSLNTYYECTDSDRMINYDQLGYYPIKNQQKVGLAFIINQQLFSKDGENHHEFPNRDGSNVDKIRLAETLEKFNFMVCVADNLTSKKIVPSIAKVIKTKFESTHSIFILCILSHGIIGQIFGTDCIPVKIKDIQKVIDTEGREKLKNIPKVIFLQACQLVEKFVPDAPLAIDYLIHWATSPEFEAFRGENGSIFIQVLCQILAEYGQKDHLVNICTRVNNYVNKICIKENVLQLPNFKSTLTKNIYLSPSI